MKKSKFGSIIGTTVLAAFGMAFIPSLINKCAAKIYKAEQKSSLTDTDNLNFSAMTKEQK